jgi:predicted ATPase
LSTVNAVESPTASLVKKEIKSWRILQLEPSALRKPDSFDAENEMGVDGSHLPATLFYLANATEKQAKDLPPRWVYDQLAHRLRDLIGEISKVKVDQDNMRRLFTLMAYDRDGTPYPARSLSDGTLRFLALAVIELDFRAEGLFCLEEPENGIHPERVPAMIKLLQDIAVDPALAPASDNLLRQVIVNTHSPLVVSEVPDDSLLIVSLKEVVKDGRRFKGADFNWLSDTWRQRILGDKSPIDKGSLLNYLNPITPDLPDEPSEYLEAGINKKKKVKQREDLQMLLPFYSDDEE